MWNASSKESESVESVKLCQRDGKWMEGMKKEKRRRWVTRMH